MLHAPERTAQHRVGEMSRALEGRDADGEELPDAKMPRAPGHLLPCADQPGRDLADRALSGARRRVRVQVEAARQIENAFHRSVNDGEEFDDRHRGFDLVGATPFALLRLRRADEKPELVAQVAEDHPAMLAPRIHPPRERDGLADVGKAELLAMMRAVHKERAW